MDTVNYTREEERQVADCLERDQHPTCPRCGTPMDRRSVSPRREVAYVRERVWLLCRSCRRSMVLEKPGG